MMEQYRDALKAPAEWVTTDNPQYTSVHHLAVLRVDERPSFLATMREHDIGYDLHYPYWIGSVPLIAEHLDQRFDQEVFPVSASLAQSVVSVPLGPWVSDEDTQKVCNFLSHSTSLRSPLIS